MGYLGFLYTLARGGGRKNAAKALLLPDPAALRLALGDGGGAEWATVSGAAPLALPNAVEKAIARLIQYGKCTQSGTPMPDAPVDIVCNNGALKYSANMANVNEQTARVGYYISAQGAVLADTYNWYYQRFIPVKPNTTYTLSMSQPVYYVTISEYSTAENSGFIVRKTGTAGSNTSLTITTGAKTNFIRFGTNLNRVVVTLERVLAINWMLNIGGTAMDYQPYVAGGIYTDGTPEVLTVSGKNLINPDAAGVVNGSYINDGGDLLVDGLSFLSDYIPVVEGETYTAQGYKTATGAANLRIHGFDASKTWIRMLAKKPMNPNEVTSATSVIPSDVKYVRVCGYIGYLRGKDAMLELGYTATEYEPYVTPQTASVPMLWGVDDYKDEGEIISGGVTHRVGTKVFDGTEAWRVSSSANIYILTSEIGVNLTAICTHFVKVSNTTTAANMSDGSFKGHPSQTVLYFKDEAAGSLADFKAWIAAQYAAGTPVIVLYPMESEITEKVSAQPLHTAAGNNVINATAAVGGVELEAEYAARKQ